MKVAVIGAGLGGLCLAQGLRGAGVEVEVYERDPDVSGRFQGYRIGLGDLGCDAMLSCLPERLRELFAATTGTLSGSRENYGPDLELRDSRPPMSATTVDRQVLRQLLLTGIDVRFGKRLSGYRVLGDGRVRAGFADGSVTEADLLVGADGINSAVRAQLDPDTEPEDTGVRCVIGRTPLTDRFAALVPGFGAGVSDGEVMLMIGLMRFRRAPREAGAELGVPLPDVGDYVRWVLMPVPDHEDRPPRDTVLAAIDGWHPDLRALVEAADPRHTSRLAIRVVRPGARWPLGPVTLLGDAIHATSPSGGNGANTALYDARRLRDLLVEPRADLLGAVDAYETAMFDYGARAVEYSVAALDQFLPARPAA
ncbi:FAD-dependent oxidoreductase [Amycolatopsis samaneae]|uniref:NAD(P)/FAD-dependent oxidoreductase n=1 Tax=Amycolatopsis samaneae TaxID=664691 RepID=A0ABW5GHX9_9PSEU